MTLGLLQPTLDNIKTDNKNNSFNCLFECLTKWLNRADSVNNVGVPTWNSLANGLYRINENTIAKQLMEIG